MEDLDLETMGDGPDIDALEGAWRDENPPEERDNGVSPTPEEWDASQRSQRPAEVESAPQPQGYEQQPQAPQEYLPNTVPRETLNGVLQELQRVRAEKAQLQQQHEQYLRAIAEKTGAVEAPQQPEEDQDPVSLITRQLAEIRTWQANQDHAQQQHIAAQRHREALDNDIRHARENLPGFDQAFDHVTQRVEQSLRMQGISDPAVLRQQMMQWRGQFVAQAIQAGRSPAQSLYAFAYQNGFNPQAAQAPPAAPPSRLDTLQQRYDAAAGIPGGGRAVSAPNGIPRTEKQLAALSEQELAQLLDSMGDGADAYLYDITVGGNG